MESTNYLSTINKDEIEEIKNNTKYYNDFPKPGIVFYDIFSILCNVDLSEKLFSNCANAINDFLVNTSKTIDVIIGLESRGFLIGTTLARQLKVPFVPIRKKKDNHSKLPGKIHSVEYGTEYSKDAFDLQEEPFSLYKKVLLVDDLLATGGSLKAAQDLCKLAGGEVVAAFCVFRLKDLQGELKLDDPSSCIGLIDI